MIANASLNIFLESLLNLIVYVLKNLKSLITRPLLSMASDTGIKVNYVNREICKNQMLPKMEWARHWYFVWFNPHNFFLFYFSRFSNACGRYNLLKIVVVLLKKKTSKETMHSEKSWWGNFFKEIQHRHTKDLWGILDKG